MSKFTSLDDSFSSTLLQVHVYRDTLYCLILWNSSLRQHFHQNLFMQKWTDIVFCCIILCFLQEVIVLVEAGTIHTTQKRWQIFPMTTMSSHTMGLKRFIILIGVSLSKLHIDHATHHVQGNDTIYHHPHLFYPCSQEPYSLWSWSMYSTHSKQFPTTDWLYFYVSRQQTGNKNKMQS